MKTTGKYEAVVIGCSAGGLTALSNLLESLPSNYSLPVLVVQHRVKEQGNLLEEILQSKCQITIKQADEKEKIKEAVVYVAPPDYHLLVEADKSLSLSHDELVFFSRPSIDVLFESAAEVYRESLIALILTGANNDGTAGLLAVKKAGGVSIAQDPATAEFPFMPASAIAANAVDHTWCLENIRHFLLNHHLT